MDIIEQQVAGLVTSMQALTQTIATVLTNVNTTMNNVANLTTTSGGTVSGTPTVDFTTVTDAIAAAQVAIITEVQNAETQLKEVIADIES